MSVWGFPGGTSGKEPICQCRRLRDGSSIPGSGRSPGAGHGNSLQYFCLKKSHDRGAWWATVCGVAKSQTRLKWLSRHANVYLLPTSAGAPGPRGWEEGRWGLTQKWWGSWEWAVQMELWGILQIRIPAPQRYNRNPWESHVLKSSWQNT